LEESPHYTDAGVLYNSTKTTCQFVMLYV